MSCVLFLPRRLRCADALGDLVVERSSNFRPILGRCLTASGWKKFESVTQLIVQGPRQTVCPCLNHRSDAKPKLSIRGKRKASLVKFRDAVMDRDQRVGGFRKLAIEVREAF